MDRNHFNGLTLRGKINLLVFLNITFVLLLIMAALTYLTIQREFKISGQNALHLAKTVADLPQINEAFKDPNPATIIAPFVERIRQDENAEFIVVGNMDLIRYSHPNPMQIGKEMVGADDGLVLQGKESITEAVGTLGLSIRGKCPIFDSDHHQIGVVSVGFLEEDIWNQIFTMLLKFTVFLILSLLFGLCGAHLLSGHIKKQIFNMEPKEIALLAQQQSVILESIREGIIAVDHEGTIITCNQEAKKVMEWIDQNPVGKDITSILPNSRLPEVLTSGLAQFDQPMLIGNSLVIVNRVPLRIDNEIIGAVSTFRDKMQLDQMDQRLADIGQYVDTIRSQRHEFMNKLHLISGLISMQDYHSAKEVIESVHTDQQKILDFFLARVRDSAVVGILLGKLHRAKELGITLNIDKESVLGDKPCLREVIITFLGNAIENSFEALTTAKRTAFHPSVDVSLIEKRDHIFLSVKDNGPGVDPSIGNRMFEDGVSTKGKGRGLGLALLHRLISNLNGQIKMQTSTNGSTLTAFIPIWEEESV